MSAYEGSYATLLRGVSEQIIQDRLAGQLEAQTNMISDPVTGLRRRTGIKFLHTLVGVNAVKGIFAQYVELSGKQVHVAVYPASGVLEVRDTSGALLTSFTNAYLAADNANNIRSTVFVNKLWLANTEAKPTSTSGVVNANPTNKGFFYVKQAAFEKEYSVIVDNVAYTYTTPASTVPNAASLSSPEHIVGQLITQLQAAGYATQVYGAYGYLAHPTITNITVSTRLSPNFMVTSNRMVLARPEDLPAYAGAAQEGWVVAVGVSENTMVYYCWRNATNSWVECAKWGDANAGWDNVPVCLAFDGTNFTLEVTAFETRLAGNQTNNPNHQWLTQGITGLSSFQGRLVILSGSYVSASAAGNPRRFYRSTVTDIRNDDAIELSSGSTAGAKYEWGVQYNRDLVLIAATHQAVLSGNQLLSPTNAAIAVTATADVDIAAQPVVVGKSLMFATVANSNRFGMSEFVPADVASQYVANNLTDHLPSYLVGACSNFASSDTLRAVVIQTAANLNLLYVYQYLWQDAERTQSAFHTWEFSEDILSVVYARDKFIVYYKDNNGVHMGSISTQASLDTTQPQPHLDGYVQVSVTNNTFTIPPHLHNKIIKACIPTGDKALEPIGVTVNGVVGTTVRSYPNGLLYIGCAYESSFVPTPPLMKDDNNNVITTAKVTVLRYRASTHNTGEFKINGYGVSAIQWASTDLGHARTTSDRGVVTIPVRATPDRAYVKFNTSDTREMNVTDLEYTLRYVQPRKRI